MRVLSTKSKQWATARWSALLVLGAVVGVCAVVVMLRTAAAPKVVTALVGAVAVAGFLTAIMAGITVFLRKYGARVIDLAEVHRAALGPSLGQGVDERRLAQILDEHPALVDLAEERGWGDTEVRRRLAKLVSDAGLLNAPADQSKRRQR